MLAVALQFEHIGEFGEEGGRRSYDGFSMVVDELPNVLCENCLIKKAFWMAQQVTRVYGNNDTLRGFTMEEVSADALQKLSNIPFWLLNGAIKRFSVTEKEYLDISNSILRCRKAEKDYGAYFYDERYVELEEYDPEYPECKHEKILSYACETTIRVLRNVRVGDEVVCCHIKYEPDWDDENWDDREDNLIYDIVLVLRPFRGWARVRHVLRTRAIIIYWLFLTVKRMAPGGSAFQRDMEEFQDYFL